VNHVGSVLCGCRDHFLRPDVGLYESGAAPIGVGPTLRNGEFMEYAIAGITAVLLFIYLMYALLRPERF
jgi:K+-transporting ATPase KdpF subunit